MYIYAIPVNEVKDNLSIVSFVRHPMLDGIVPWRDVDCKYSDDKLGIDHKASGREPRIYMYMHKYMTMHTHSCVHV
jgi:hypothetical protein